MSQPRHVVCPHCEAVNRIPDDRLNQQPKCGKCREPLFTGTPVELNDGNFNRHISRSDLPLVVDFWASWCVPCRRSFPWLNAMHDKYGDDGLVIIGVNLDESRADAEDFLREYPTKFAIHYDVDKTLAREFDVMGMPMSYVIGRDGQQVAKHFGFKVRKEAEYEAVIVEALGLQE